MIYALKQAHLRWPGGSDLQGNELNQRWRPLPTLRHTAERPLRISFSETGYPTDDGMGYHKYLQFVEDLGAVSVYGVNAGLTHGNEKAPMEEMGPYVQEALDSIAYAIEPETSAWGRKHAANGHPAPFRIKCVEIGNEHGGPACDERFALFYDAIKARFPGIKVIATNRHKDPFPTSRQPDIHDEHYYHTPEWFLQHSHHFDAYPRSGPPIYIGEFGVEVPGQDVSPSRMRHALAEGAFVTGLERNADVVMMCTIGQTISYASAPSYWEPNAIYMNSAAVYGTPSYHMLKMCWQN